MAKGNWMPIWVKHHIGEIYYAAIDKGINLSAPKVHKELQNWLAERNQLELFPVSLRTVQAVLTELRRPVAPDDEDSAWSMGMSVKHNLSPEATSHLCDLWEWCLAAGCEFTIRHAKWACYLRDVVKGSWGMNPDEVVSSILYDYSEMYSVRERVCKALRIDLDTVDLDAHVLSPSWGWETVKMVGAIDQDRAVLQKLPSLGIDKPRFTWGRRAGELVQEQLELKDMPTYDLEGETDRVYAHWLRYMSKGPRWKSMSPDERRSMAILLREDVKNQGILIDAEPGSHFDWRPLKLIREVGYQANNAP